MVKVLAGIFVAVLFALAVKVNGNAVDDRYTIQFLDWDQFLNLLCSNLPQQVTMSVCDSTKTTTAATSPAGVPSVGQSSSAKPTVGTTNPVTSSSSASPLEQAHWCQFSNGSYLSYGQTFIYNDCSVCQCTSSRQIRCSTRPCMADYCIDGSTPVRRPGQCCSQCSYEADPTQCVVNQLPFPHGTVLKQTSDGLTCWCQLGNVECRKVSTNMLSSLDYWGKGTAVYVIVIVICVIVILGSLLCLGSGLFFYYYYKKDQQATQQAYEQYYNSAGWQPMPGDGQVVDPAAEEKKAEAEAEAEAEQYQYTFEGDNNQYIPPPYAIYNGAYANEQDQKS